MNVFDGKIWVKHDEDMLKHTKQEVYQAVSELLTSHQPGSGIEPFVLSQNGSTFCAKWH